MSETSDAEVQYIFTEICSNGIQISISEREFHRLKRTRKLLREIQEIEDLYSLIVISFIELEKYLLTAGFDSLMNNFIEEFDQENFFDNFRDKINLLLMTLLNAARAHENQCSSRLGKIKSLASEDRKYPKFIFSAAFDRSFEYRVMYGLRNLGQHSQLPIDGLSFSSTKDWAGGHYVEGAAARSRFTVNPYLLSYDISASKKVNSKTRDEIQAKKCSKLDLKFMVRTYVSELSLIQKQIRIDTKSIVAKCLSDLACAKANLAGEKKVPANRIAIWKKIDGKIVERINIDHKRLSRILLHRKRWAHLEFVNQTYISSEVLLQNDTYPDKNQVVLVTK